MSASTVTKRKKPPTAEVFEARRTWGGRVLLELNAIRRTPEWLGERVGYSTPASMRQVINGHQGVSREIYERILEELPEMKDVPAPPITRDAQGAGAYGEHRPHDYPKLGTIESRRPRS